MKTSQARLVLFLCLLSSAHAPGELLADDYLVHIQKCKQLSNNEDRLQCFDAIAAPTGETRQHEQGVEVSVVGAQDYSKIDVKTLEEVFCGSNKAVLRIDPFSKNDQKELINCESGMKYYLIKWSGKPGYTWGNVIVYKKGKPFKDGWIENTDLLTREEWEPKRAALAAEEKRKAEREKAIGRQPAKFQDLIRKGTVVIGMTKEAVKLSLGEPEEVNRTVSPGRVHEQWVYGRGAYIYIENDIVTSFQD